MSSAMTSAFEILATGSAKRDFVRRPFSLSHQTPVAFLGPKPYSHTARERVGV